MHKRVLQSDFSFFNLLYPKLTCPIFVRFNTQTHTAALDCGSSFFIDPKTESHIKL